MILIKFCESIVLITGHFNVDAGKIALEWVQTLVILLNLSVKFMSLHLDSREIYLLLLLRLLLVRPHLRWIIHGSSSHLLLTLHRLSTLSIGYTSCLAIRLLPLQTSLLHGVTLLPRRHASHNAWTHHSTGTLRRVYTWHSYTWLPLWHLHGEICWKAGRYLMACYYRLLIL